jgi:hypothetical protein
MSVRSEGAAPRRFNGADCPLWAANGRSTSSANLLGVGSSKTRKSQIADSARVIAVRRAKPEG